MTNMLIPGVAKIIDRYFPDRSKYTEAELQCVEDAVTNDVIYVQTYMRDVKTFELHQVNCEAFRYRKVDKAMEFAMDEVTMLLSYCTGFEYRKKSVFESVVIIGGKDFGPEIKEMKLPRNDIILFDLKKELANKVSFTMFDDVRKQKFAKKFQLETKIEPAQYGVSPDENGNFLLSYQGNFVTNFSRFGEGFPIRASADMKAGAIIKCSSEGGACPLNEKDIGAYVLGFITESCKQGGIVKANCTFGARMYQYTGASFNFYLFNYNLKKKTIERCLKAISEKKDVRYFAKIVRDMLIKIRDIDDLVKVQKYFEIKTSDWHEYFQIVVTSHGIYNFYSLISGRGKINQRLINYISQHGSVDITQGEHWIGETHYPERVVATICKQDIANSKGQWHRIEKMVEVIRKGI